MVSDQYAVGAISLYLETDHPVLGLFDTQLFVDSLLQCKLDHCSRFLVNALLAFASVSSEHFRKSGTNRSISKRMLSKTLRLSPKAMNLKKRL